MKYLWALLPLSALWIAFYVGYQFMPSDPRGAWWASPLIITLTTSVCVSVWIAISKIFD